MTFSGNGGYDDGKLSAGECVRVDYVIGLKEIKRFKFLVDVFGVKE